MPRGRTSRTPENREAILRLLRAGNTRQDAALYIGISRDALWEWVRRDATFQREVLQAETYARVAAVAVINDDARGRPAQHDDAGRVIRAEVKPNVNSAMWLLERRDPLNWGRRMTVDINDTVRRYAEAEGFDPADVMAEVQSLMAEHADTMRGG